MNQPPTYSLPSQDHDMAPSHGASAPGRSGAILFIAFILLSFGTVVVFLKYFEATRANTALDATALLGEEVPQPFKDAEAFQAEDGSIVQLFVPDRATKLSLALSSLPTGSPGMVEELFPKLGRYRIAKIMDAQLSPLSLSFLSSQFDPKRAKNYEKVLIPLGGKQLIANRVEGRGEEYFLFGTLAAEDRQIAYIFFTLKKPLDASIAGELLNSLALIRNALPALP